MVFTPQERKDLISSLHFEDTSYTKLIFEIKLERHTSEA